MAKCPECGTLVPEPYKVFRNPAFCIEAYICPNCRKHFHITK